LCCGELASGRQPFRIGRNDGQDAPEPALHSDRRADTASGAAVGEERGDRAGRALESIDAGGASLVMYLHDDTGACDVETRPDRNFDAGDAPAAD
jgi:hypothetical protein